MYLFVSIRVSIILCLVYPSLPLSLSLWHPNDYYLLPINPCFSQACQGWSPCPQANPLSLFHYPPLHAVGWERVALHRCFSPTLSVNVSLSLSFYATVWHFLCLISSSLLPSVCCFSLSFSILCLFFLCSCRCLHTHTPTHTLLSPEAEDSL